MSISWKAMGRNVAIASVAMFSIASIATAPAYAESNLPLTEWPLSSV